VDSNAFWLKVLSHMPNGVKGELADIMVRAEPLRAKAKYNTGSINYTTALALRCLCQWFTPRTAIEVGTFIGVSTRALQARDIYTCDASNDCLSPGPGLTVHPYTTSTEMFNRLLTQGVLPNIFFFDGRLGTGDVPLVIALSAPGCVYVFDDYNEEHKGVKNVQALRPALPNHVLFLAAGPVSDTTLAALVPADLL